MSVIGEVRTSLVQTSAALDDEAVETMLDLFPGRYVERITRPVRHAASPDRFVGVDCSLALTSRTVRAVGTVKHRTLVTGGHLVQGSAVAEVAVSTARRRLSWSHYLAAPGRLEMIGKGQPDEAASVFVGGSHRDDGRLLDIGAVADRAIESAQADFGRLDREPPLRTPRGALRWSAVYGARRPSVDLKLENGLIRSVALELPPGADPAHARAFCEDLALHDWLLTTVDRIVHNAGIGRRPSAAIVDRLRPAIDHLLHLWSPGARRTPLGLELWPAVQSAAGLDNQWQILNRRIRDQLALPRTPEPIKEYAV